MKQFFDGSHGRQLSESIYRFYHVSPHLSARSLGGYFIQATIKNSVLEHYFYWDPEVRGKADKWQLLGCSLVTTGIKLIWSSKGHTVIMMHVCQCTTSCSFPQLVDQSLYLLSVPSLQEQKQFSNLSGLTKMFKRNILDIIEARLSTILNSYALTPLLWLQTGMFPTLVDAQQEVHLGLHCTIMTANAEHQSFFQINNKHGSQRLIFHIMLKAPKELQND